MEEETGDCTLIIIPFLLEKHMYRKNTNGFVIFPSFLKPPTDGSFIRIKMREVPSTGVHTKSFSHLAFMGMTPLEPTPTGIWSNIAWASCSFTGCTSLSSKFVRSKRTPQLMSNPTPPRSVGKATELIKGVLVVRICWVFILNLKSLLTGSMHQMLWSYTFLTQYCK